MGDLIQTTAALEGACERIRQDGLIALDTEFVWKCTYLPCLGIVQMGGRDFCCAVDCRSGLDTSALRDMIEDHAVVKILHDARQDLTLLRHWTGASPRNVFDTQLAAAFADLPKGLGLQKLLFEMLDVGLAKTETCTDWTQRPLSDAQVRYALDDVRYLPALRDALVARCAELGTLAWLDEERAAADDANVYLDCPPDELWKRIKTHRARLGGRGFAVLRAVAALREKLAREWNLPRNWLGDDGSLVRMAEKGRVERLVHRLRGGRGDTVRALFESAIAEALATPEDEWPEDPARHYIPEVLDAADRAIDWLDEKARSLHVDPGVVANRSTVTAFVDDVGDETNPLATGWRHEIAGAEMAELFGVE